MFTHYIHTVANIQCHVVRKKGNPKFQVLNRNLLNSIIEYPRIIHTRILNHAGHLDVGPGAVFPTLILSGGVWRIVEIGTLGPSVRREFNVVIELDWIV